LGEYVVVGLYALWFALSVARQASASARQRIGRWDVLQLVPGWALFETPAGLDFTFAQRYVLRDGTSTEWHPVFAQAPRPRMAWLWHPQMIRQMVAMEIAGRTMRVTDAASRRKLQSSDRYRTFFAWLSGRPHSADAIALQLIIFGDRWYDSSVKREVIFLSDVVDLRP
jgi:hypothetical protein